MPFDPILAAIRFGTGLSPVLPPPGSAKAMLAQLTGRDDVARQLPIAPFTEARPTLNQLRDAKRAARTAAGTAQAGAARDAARARNLEAVTTRQRHFATTLARGVIAPEGGLRERMLSFWADHFTVTSRSGNTVHLITPFVEEAIRPHLGGRFGDMLLAVTTHPMMLAYLDQSRSIGPNSAAARRDGGGLNENLARELLELHTVGVDGPYDQADVRQLAELLTGLSWTPERGMEYRPTHAEPGAETVLGTTFAEAPRFDTIRSALQMLATHPATAAHLARKLAVHFVSDDPDPDLVAALEAQFLDTRGDLAAVTAALLDHPASWAPEARKVKPPLGYMQSALRALAVPPEMLIEADRQTWRRLIERPLRVMGQTWERAPGPDGWPEAAGAWITPQGMAGRIDWAMRAPTELLAALPDPRDFVMTALGPEPPEPVVFAARAAESLPEGIGVILASAAFQRR